MSSLVRDYQEKRDFIRMNLSVPATLTLSDGSTHNVTCVDLSSSGAQLQHSSAIKTGLTGYLRIASGGGTTSALEAEITVQRVHEIGQKQFSIGVIVTKYA